ncbi:MAG: hypothetical protein MR266_06120 [Erysipelotrichaceae bacterium]|nr:hypothetical protein [Erysipelotrichaceae bacterium]
MKLPNVDPKLFSFSAVIVGYLLIDDMTANEQNALGNWLMLTAQVISTNAFYRQVLEERKNNNDMTKDDIIKMLNKLIEAILEGIDNLDK